jgi:hypothetical protein
VFLISEYLTEGVITKAKIMKSLIFVLFFIPATVVNSQERKASIATVEKVSGVPIFLMAKPVAEYEVTGKAVSGGYVIKMTVNESSSLQDKAEAMVAKAKERVEAGKLPEFDAIILDLYKEKNKAIKFKDDVSLKAEVVREDGVPIYFYSKPDDEYEVVAKLPKDYSAYAARNLLLDKIRSSINRILKKEEAGEVGKFDAVIFNPDDFSTTLIKFN